MTGIRLYLWCVSVLWPLVFCGGCAGPLDRSLEQELREHLMTTQRTYRQAVAQGPVIDMQRTSSEVESKLSLDRRHELDRIGGPGAYEGVELELGSDLLGSTDVQTATISLQDALHLAARNNLQVSLARMAPAIRQTTITQAEAVFDATLFGSYNFRKSDTQFVDSADFRFGSSDTRTFATGIRKPLSSGGQIELTTEFNRRQDAATFFGNRSGYEAAAALGLTQPLLRGFGEDVARAQIMLQRSSRASDTQELRRQLLQIINDTESAYWNLVFARYRLLYQQRLLARTIEDRDKVEARLGLDATPVEVTQANSFVESNRADVIRAVNRVRTGSDTLKQLINSPDFTVADELQLVPVDLPADLPIKFSMLDAITTAMRHRPEIQQVLMNIQDAAIRQRVADNLRLPQLDLNARVRWDGTSQQESLVQAYEKVDADLINYLVGLQFAVPIGNRGAEALYRQRQLERRAAVIAYQNTAQQIVQDVNNSLRLVIDAYRLIGATRGARLAAADNLRALVERERAGEPMTPQFLDLRLRRSQGLTNAENQEMQALTGYQVALADLYQAMGTLLDRSGIEFSDQPIQ